MGEEGEREARADALAPFQVTAELMALAKPEASSSTAFRPNEARRWRPQSSTGRSRSSGSSPRTDCRPKRRSYSRSCEGCDAGGVAAMRIVVALGGNALLRRGEPAEAAIQRAHVLEAASALAALAATEELVITHGNGPQVGLLALEADAYKAVAPYPLDVLGAESQGMIGYLLAQALRAELPDRDVVALLTQVLVDADDLAFRQPTKPIGPVYSEHEARELAAERGWTIAPRRRALPPRRRLARATRDRRARAIELLVAAGSVVICAGGGGIPVFADGDGLHGVEAVIDKDLTAALLAEELGAERLIVLTDVSCVERDWGRRRDADRRRDARRAARSSRSHPARWARRSKRPVVLSSARAARP